MSAIFLSGAGDFCPSAEVHRRTAAAIKLRIREQEIWSRIRPHFAHDYLLGGLLPPACGLAAPGDIVPAKKPDPAIYEMAVARLEVAPDEVIVIEDSRNGLLAAVGANLRCVVTVNGYTATEDMSEAVLVVTSLGDPGEPAQVLANRGAAQPGDLVVWTPPSRGQHVAVVVAGGVDPMLVSHGDDTGPKRLRFSAEDASQRRRGHGTAVWLTAF